MLSTSLEKKILFINIQTFSISRTLNVVKLSTKHGVKNGVSLIFEEVGKLEKVFGI